MIWNAAKYAWPDEAPSALNGCYTIRQSTWLIAEGAGANAARQYADVPEQRRPRRTSVVMYVTFMANFFMSGRRDQSDLFMRS